MKKTTLLPLLLLTASGVTWAAGVRLEHLQDFDRQAHSIGVNVQVEVKGACRVDAADLEKTFRGLLGVFGFSTAALEESSLEFAVSVKGRYESGAQPCGIKQLSMVRQVPKIRMLRLPPGSTSTRYRLWSSETVITAGPDDIQAKLRQQATEDVFAFVRMLDQQNR